MRTTTPAATKIAYPANPQRKGRRPGRTYAASGGMFITRSLLWGCGTDSTRRIDSMSWEQ